jgi:hypothetical protein
VRIAVLLAVLASCAVALGADAGSSATGDFRCRGAIATLVGTAGDDRLRGTPHDDVIVARAGNDVVYGLAGDDRVCDNDGTDHVFLGQGEDQAGGGAGNDHIEGGSGDDWLAGRRGNDTIEGDAGNDRIIGEVGNDKLRGEGGNDNIGGGVGTDNCTGGPGRDRVRTCETGDPHSDRPPNAVDDSDATSEATAKDVAVLANDSDPDGDPVRVGTIDTSGTAGNVTISGARTGVRYDPNGRFASLAAGESATDSFRYSLGGGAGFATVTMTISGTDTHPTAVADTRAGITEDDPAQAIDVLANDTDPDGGASKSIASVTQPPNGTVAITGGGAGLTYLPNHDYCNSGGLGSPDSFSYALTPGGASSTVAVTVDCVNDAPLLSLVGTTLAYNEGVGALEVDDALSVPDDVDSAKLSEATAQITGNFTAGEDTLGWVDNNLADNITLGSISPSTITLAGADTPGNYELALRALTYANSSDTPTTTTRTVSMHVTDSSAEDSGTETRDISVAPTNDAPVLTTTAGSTTVAEDALATVDGALTLADADDTDIESARVRVSSGFQSGDDLVFVNQNGISGVYNTGTGVLSMTGTSSVANYQTAFRSIQFRTTNDAPSASKTVDFRVNDGSADSNTPTRNITVTGVNDAPTLNTTSADLDYGEGDGLVAIDSGLTATDPDSANLQSATVSITSNFVSAEDTLQFTNQLGITGSYNSGTGVLTLTGNAPKLDWQNALHAVRYSNSSDNPSTADRTVSFKVNDGSADSNVATRDITVGPANDAPVVTTSGGSTAYTEGGSAPAIDSALTVSDIDDTNIESAQVRLSSNFQSGDNLNFVNTPSISGVYNSGTGVLTLSGTDTKANYQAALRSITYSHTGDNPGSSKTVEFKANDGSPGLDSNLATKILAITGVNDAPTLTATVADLGYTEGAGAVAVDPGLTATDPDSANFQGATVSITGNFLSAEDALNFVNQNGISGTYNSGTGVLTLSGSASNANYETALQSVTYSNSSDNPSTADRTVSFQADDGAAANNLSNVATRDITVGPANDAPVVTTSGGSTAYTEGGSAPAIDNALTVSDIDDTNLESAQVRISSNFQSGDDLVFVNQNGISGVYNTGTGVLSMTGTSSVANYQTAFRSIQFQHTGDNPGSSKTVEFKANDGSPGLDSNLATKVISITGVNDAPVLTTTVADRAYTEGNTTAVDSGLTLTDPDSANLQGATVSITGNFLSTEDALNFVNQNGISGTYNSGTGVLTLSGSASNANYQTALRSVTYSNSSDNPDTSDRTVSFQANDGAAANNLSNVATRDITVARVNDAPVVTTTIPDTTYNEGDPAVTIDGGVTVVDPDDTSLEAAQVRVSTGFQSGDDLVFVNQNGISGVYNTGTGVLTMTGTSSVANYQTAFQSIQFQSTNTNLNDKTVEFRANDGSVDSNLATKDISTADVNSPPAIAAGPLSYTENDAATPLDSTLTVTDPDSTDIASASASVTTNFQSSEDALAWVDNDTGDGITLDGSSDDQTIELSGTDTLANYQAALRAVTYENSSDDPDTSTRTVTLSATDDDTLDPRTGTDTLGITVVAEDDPPIANPDSGTVLEDAAATSVNVLGNDDNTLDGGPMTIASATDPANGTVVLTGGSPGAHTGLTYQPDPNYCNDGPIAPDDTFDYTLNGGNSATVSIAVTCVNDAPVADNETFNGNDSAHGNTTLQVDAPDDNKSAPTEPHTEITGDILAGDTDLDGPGPIIVQSAGSDAGATNGQTADGGTISIESDGDFVYRPPASTSCDNGTDSFNYKISDQASSGGGPLPGTAIGTVTIQLQGCVWYVNNNAAGNSGTSSQPFDTLAQAETASGANHTVFVFDGDNSSTGYDTGYAMNSGERLIGESEGLVVDPDQGGALTADTLYAAAAGAQPTLTANDEDVVALDDGNEVRGFDIDPQGTGGGIAGGAGDTLGGTIDDVNIVDTGTAGDEPGLELNGTTGTFNVPDFTYSNTGAPSAAAAVALTSAGTVSFGAGDAGDPTKIDKAGGPALNVLSTSMGTSTFNEIKVAGSATGGIDLTNITAGSSTTFGDGSGTDLDLTTTGGSAAAFRVSSGSGITVPAGGSADAHATGGPAVDVTSTGGATLAFDDVDSTNSASDGINLAGLGTGTFSATSGTIIGASGVSFDLDDGSGAITYPGDLLNGTGQAAEITSRDGGAVSLSGAIGDTSDAGGGIVVSGNNAGTTTFSNASKTINTTTSGGGGNPINNAVVMSGSDGHTLTLSGGGLDIDTSVGSGLAATGSGVLNVIGTGNSIVTTTGNALEVSDTDVGGTPLTFQSISANGPANGIKLNNTGANSALNVTSTGVGTCTNADTTGCTGGSIGNTTGVDNTGTTPAGTAVMLNNTRGITLNRMRLFNNSNYGIRGNGVVGMTMAHSVINGTNGTSTLTEHRDSAARFTELTGTVSVTDTDIAGGMWANLEVINTAGTLDATLTSVNSLSMNQNNGANNAVMFEGIETAGVNLAYEDGSITSARGQMFHYIAGGTGGGSLSLTGNTLHNANPLANQSTGGGGVSAVGGARGATTMDISNNSIRGVKTNALTVIKSRHTGGGNNSMTTTIADNLIGLAGSANSGSSEGDGMELSAFGQGNAAYDVTGNTIRQYNSSGIQFVAGGGIAESGQFNLNVSGNTIQEPGNNPLITLLQGIRLDSGVDPGDTFESCIKFGANTITGSSDAANKDFRLVANGSTKIRQPGYAGGSTDGTAFASFAASLIGGGAQGTAIANPGGTFTGTGATCP